MQYRNPVDKSIINLIIVLIIIINMICICWIYYYNTLVAKLVMMIVLLLLNGIPIYLILIYILLRPIVIQIIDTGVILQYHFGKIFNVSWEEIEYVSRIEQHDESDDNKLKNGGKMKVRYQQYPFFIPNDIAKIIMSAYNGKGTLHRYNNVLVIE